MIFADPVIRRTGDMSLVVEFGDEINFDVSCRVLALAQFLEANAIPGALETIPTHRSIGIVIDSLRLGARQAEDAVLEAVRAATNISRLRSRVVHIPLLYDDPWSRHCAEVHGARPSIDVIAETNRITSEDVARRHSETDHWVGALGFTPGCTQAFPMHTSHALSAPKYQVPRKWTYARIVGLGGILTSPYTVRSPGGYQMLGRTPLDWYDPTHKNPTFGDDIVLCRVGDRQRFVPIDLETYDGMREEVVLGRYQYLLEEAEITIGEPR